MDRDEEIKRALPQLKGFALACLLAHCTARKPRLHKTASAYVERAVERFRKDCVAAPNDVRSAPARESLMGIIRELVDGDDLRTTEIIANADWERITRAVLLFAAIRYRTAEIQGRSLSEYFQDAVVQLLERRRNFPHHRGIDLQVFLWQTMRSIIDHHRRNGGGDRPLGLGDFPVDRVPPLLR